MSEADITLEYTITDDEYQKLYKFIVEHGDEFAYDVNHLLAQECYKAAIKITKNAIDMFYGAYSPHLYKRTNSLYDIFDIQVSGDDFIFAVDDDLMGWHRSNEAVLELDFMQGFHGGSRWRNPPYATEANPVIVFDPDEGEEAIATHPWQYWHPTPAARSYPPYVSIQINWSAFLKGRYQQLKKQIINKVAEKYSSYFSK